MGASYYFMWVCISSCAAGYFFVEYIKTKSLALLIFFIANLICVIAQATIFSYIIFNK